MVESYDHQPTFACVRLTVGSVFAPIYGVGSLLQGRVDVNTRMVKRHMSYLEIGMTRTDGQGLR